MGQPHKHAEIIKAWADGAEIELMKIDGTWANADVPTWSEWCTYRIKSEPPKYPQTKLTDDELLNAFEQCGAANIDRARFIANAAISRAIEDGDVVPEAMLEKVAKRVEQEYIWHTSFNIASAKDAFHGLNIQAIIKRVKEGK